MKPAPEAIHEPPGKLSVYSTPFNRLVELDPELAELRRHYGAKSPKQRRKAAEWAYDEGVANDLFNRGLMGAGLETLPEPRWPSGIEALAIDPLYAPALLTVGSIEYQARRPEEAMGLFLKLTELPEDTEDLSVIIDKAGDFLLDQEDFASALRLYSAAEQAFPRESLYPDAMGYCYGKLGEFDTAITWQRRAVALKPNDPRLLNDLGWSLVEARQYNEAQTILEQAVALSPPDYDRAGNNLKELARRKKRLAAQAQASPKPAKRPKRKPPKPESAIQTELWENPSES